MAHASLNQRWVGGGWCCNVDLHVCRWESAFTTTTNKPLVDLIFWASPNQLIQRWRSDCWFRFWLPDKSLDPFLKVFRLIGFVWYGVQIGGWFGLHHCPEIAQVARYRWNCDKHFALSLRMLGSGSQVLQQQASRFAILISSKPAATSRWKCNPQSSRGSRQRISTQSPKIAQSLYPKPIYSMSQYFIKGSLDEKLPSYEVLKMLKE